MEQLKPCPFCGGEAYFYEFERCIGCLNCGVETVSYHTEEEAIEAWNRRIEDEQKV